MKYTVLFTMLLFINSLSAMQEQEQQIIELNIKNTLPNAVNIMFTPKDNLASHPQDYVVPSKKIGTLSFEPQKEDAKLILSFTEGSWNIPIEIESKEDSYSIAVTNNNNMINVLSEKESNSKHSDCLLQIPYYNPISLGSCSTNFSTFTHLIIRNKNLFKIIIVQKALLKKTQKTITKNKISLKKGNSLRIKTGFPQTDYEELSILLIIPQAIKNVLLNIDQETVANKDIFNISKEDDSNTINIVRERKSEPNILVATLHSYYQQQPTITLKL